MSHQTTPAQCCQLSQHCRARGVCIRDLQFWDYELQHPCEEDITLGDLVIIDTTRSIFHGEFFGVVIRSLASVKTIFTPVDTIVRVCTIHLQRVHINRISKPWRDELLLKALTTGSLVLSEEEYARRSGQDTSHTS